MALSARDTRMHLAGWKECAEGAITRGMKSRWMLKKKPPITKPMKTEIERVVEDWIDKIGNEAALNMDGVGTTEEIRIIAREALTQIAEKAREDEREELLPKFETILGYLKYLNKDRVGADEITDVIKEAEEWLLQQKENKDE